MKQLQFLNAVGLAGIVSVLVSTPASAQIAEVTGVRLNPTPGGVEVILETENGKPLQAFSGSYGRTFFTDVITTKLRLPEGQPFRANNPAPGIATVTVAPLDANSIRVTVIGEAGIPTAQVTSGDRGLIVRLSSTPDSTAVGPTPTQRPVEPGTQVPPTEPTTPPGQLGTQVPPTEPTTPPGQLGTQVPPTEPTTPPGQLGTQVPPTEPTTPPGQLGTQVPPTEPTAPEDQRQTEEIPEIVVTAQRETDRVTEATTGTRTNTPIRDVPQSIQVVPQQVLEDRRVTRLEEALRSVSGVNQTTSSLSTFEQFNIRGFESVDILRNGLRDSTNTQVPNESAVIERVEVLKGPASVLFGQGSPGGVINIVTKRPEREPFYAVEFTAGSYNFYRGTVDLTGPLNADRNLLYRLNLSYQNSESFLDFAETERLLVAPAFSWAISDQTRLTLQGEIVRSSFPNPRGLPAIGTVRSNPNGRIPINRNIAEPGEDFIDNRVERVGYEVEHQFSQNWSLRNAFRLTLYSYDQDSFFPSSLEPDGRTLNRGYTTGTSSTDTQIFTTDLVGNFSTGPIEHKLLVGVELFRENQFKNRFDIGDIAPLDLFNPVYGSPLGPVTFSIDNATLTQSAGFYIQDQISILDNLKLILGGRFDLYEQKQTDKLADTRTEQSEQAFSPRVGIVYQPIQPISLYASFTRSFNPVSGTGFNNTLFQPEEGTQYEVGVKAEFLEGRLSSTLAFYQLTRQNVLTPDPRDPNFSIQTGEQRSRGIDLDISGEILPGWRITSSYAYTDARIVEDNALAIGNRINNVPQHSASLFTTYEIQNGNLQGLGFGLGLFYVGEREGDLDNSFSLPSYLRTDAAIFYRRGNLRAALNVNNLFNVRYFESTNGDLRVFPGAPLTVQGTVGFEF